MHSTELMIVIPVLIVLILTVLMMFFFATILGQAELNHSRVFMMSLSEPSDINHQMVQPNLRETIVHTPISSLLFKVFKYSPTIASDNPFSLLNNKSQFKFNLIFRMTKIDRKWISVINAGAEDFFQYKKK